MKNPEKHIRLNWIDYARGIAIILVVYRHVFEGLKSTQLLKEAGVDIDSFLYLEQANIFFFSFRMPLFFLVSGLFISSSLAKRGLNLLINNKARTILYPYFLWGCIQITIQILFSSYINSKKSIADYLYLLYVPREVEQFWYLYALFNVTVLYAFFKVKLKLTLKQQVVIGIILFMVSALFSQNGIELGFISDIFHYYIFMVLGDCLSQLMISGKLRHFFSTWKAFLILLVPFVATQYYFLTTNLAHKHISSKFLFVEYYQPFQYLLIALTGSAFIITISSLMEKYNVIKWIRYLGKYSLYIYVMHVIVFASVRVMLIYLFKVYDIHTLMLLCVAAGVLFPVIIFKISEKMKLHFLFSLEGTDQVVKQSLSQPRCKPEALYGR